MRKSTPVEERRAVSLHVGKRLRDKRRRRRLKADKLDVMIGECPGTIDKLESGARDIAPGQLIRLGRELGVEAAYFFQRIPEDFFSGGKIPVPRKEMVKETEKFIEAYYAVADSDLRKEVYHMVKLLCDPGADPRMVRSYDPGPARRRDR